MTAGSVAPGTAVTGPVDPDDPQRELVYGCEDRALAGSRRFRRFVHLEAFVAAVVAESWWAEELAERWHVLPPLEVTVARRSRSATASLAEVHRPVIHVRDGHWTASVVVHELAHLVARDPEPHGPIFCGVLLDLVNRYLGFHAAVGLRAEMATAGVRVATPHVA
jgi:putative metallohydrolase (TIGR04338 family)